MSNEHKKLAESAAEWIEAAGYGGDLSAFAAGLHDLTDSLCKMNDSTLPALLRLDRQEYDEAHAVITDLWVEFGHLERHCADAKECLFQVQQFLAIKADG